MKGNPDKSVSSQVRNLKVGESVTFTLDRITLRSARVTASDASIFLDGHVSSHLEREDRTVTFTRTK